MPPTRHEPEVGALADLEETDLEGERRGDIPGSDDVFLVCRDQGTIRVLAIAAGESVVVGRAPESTFVTTSTRVSRRHATIELEGGVLSITDHASRNGTAVNGKLLRGESRTIDGGDVIAIGSVHIVVARADQTLSRSRGDEAPAPVAPARQPVPPDALGLGYGDGLVLADRAMVKLLPSRGASPWPSRRCSSRVRPAPARR